jgi:hypothetical protein
MEKLFFQKFPEYIGEIPIHETHSNDMPSQTDVQLPDSLDGGVSVSRECGESSGSFEDECMMALFDELPPT